MCESLMFNFGELSRGNFVFAFCPRGVGRNPRGLSEFFCETRLFINDLELAIMKLLNLR